MFGFVTILSFHPLPRYRREIREEEPLLSRKKVTGWATQQEVLSVRY